MAHTSTRKNTTSILTLALIAVITILASSCQNSKNVVYFRDLSDSLNRVGNISTVEFTEVKIKPDDILNITVQTLDPQTTQAIASGSANPGTTASIGYLVDKSGYIEMPIVGKLQVAGLTLRQAKEKIREQARQYYKDPLVNVSMTNFQVTVLGDVNRPGMIAIPREKAGLVDVLGYAGDLTAFGRRDNILLIREGTNGKEYVRLNLNSAEVFQSPYYYIKQGDIIYVEPNLAKARSSTTDFTRDRYIQYAATAITVTFTIFNFIRLASQ